MERLFTAEEAMRMAMKAHNEAVPALLAAAREEWEASVKAEKSEAVDGDCFECGSSGRCHRHHVVPRVLGGTRTVLLCEACHGAVHGLKLGGHGHLTRSGLEAARRRGVVLGRPAGSRESLGSFLIKHGDVVGLLRAGKSLRDVAARTGKSQGTVVKVKRALARA